MEPIDLTITDAEMLTDSVVLKFDTAAAPDCALSRQFFRDVRFLYEAADEEERRIARDRLRTILRACEEAFDVMDQTVEEGDR